MKDNEKIVERIKELCDEKGYSFYQLSNNSGVSLSTLMHIIDFSTKSPRLETIAKLCIGFEIPLKEFFSSDLFSVIDYETVERK